MFAKGCRQLKNGKPAATGKGCSPAEFKARGKFDARVGKYYQLDPKTGLRAYFA